MIASLLASGSDLVLPGGQTLVPGEVITTAGMDLSLEPSATALVIGSTTVPLPQSASESSISVTLGLDVVAATLLPSSAGIVLPGGQMLKPGQAITTDGLVVSLAPSETALVIGGTTIPLQTMSSSPAIGSYILNGIGSTPVASGTACGTGGQSASALASASAPATAPAAQTVSASQRISGGCWYVRVQIMMGVALSFAWQLVR